MFRILTDNGSNMVVAFKIHASGNESNEEDFADHVALEDDLHLQAAQESDNEWSDVYDSEPLPENDAIAEITDFEHHEFNHDSVFTTSYKCTGCFIHTLQLVVKIFESAPSVSSRAGSYDVDSNYWLKLHNYTMNYWLNKYNYKSLVLLNFVTPTRGSQFPALT